MNKESNNGAALEDCEQRLAWPQSIAMPGSILDGSITLSSGANTTKPEIS